MKSLKNYLAIGLFSLFVAGLLAPLPADAGMVLRQSDDGTAEWVKTDSRDGNVYEIGRREYTLHFENISTHASAYFVIPVSGKVTAVYSVIYGAITGADATLTFVNGADTTTESFATLTVTQSGSAAGDADSSTGLSTAVDGTSAPFVITVGTDGGSTGDVDATITIVVDPI